MELFIIAGIFVWLWVESRDRKSKDRGLTEEIKRLRRDLEGLRNPDQASPPAAPVAAPQPILEPGIRPRAVPSAAAPEIEPVALPWPGLVPAAVPEAIAAGVPEPFAAAISEPSVAAASEPHAAAASEPFAAMASEPHAAAASEPFAAMASEPHAAAASAPFAAAASAPHAATVSDPLAAADSRPLGEEAPLATLLDSWLAALPELRGFDWESLVGVKLFSYIAGIAMLVAAVAFLRYSLDQGWLGPAVRMSFGILLGTGLLVGCESKRAQVYATTAQSLTAAGIATLFSTFFAASALWHLIPAWLGFALMALATTVAVLLSIRRNSIFIALLGLVGGFATPMLLATGHDNPLGLFGYLGLLNLGLAWVAYRKRWPLLTALTVGFTVLYQLGWAGKFLDEAKLGTGLGVFLLFPLLAFGSMLLARREQEAPVKPDLFQKATWFTALPPLVLALHVAATPAYGQHFAMMFGFLFLVAAGLAAVALFQGPEWLHALGAGGVLVLFATWMARSYTPKAWPVLLAFTGLFVGLYLALPWIQSRLRHKRPFQGVGLLGVNAAPLLLFVFPALVFLEPRNAAPGLLFGVLLGLLVLVAATAIRFQEGYLHFTACFFALATEAAWSHCYLDAHNLLSALLLYAGFALFFLAVPLWAERRGKQLLPAGSGAILAFTTLAMLLFLTAQPLAQFSLGFIAALLGLLNAGLLFEASRGRHPLLALAGMALSWFLLGVWWAVAPLAGLLLPALLVVGGFALLVLGGRCWLQAPAEAEPEPVRQAGLWLGLAGHLFLLKVVTQLGLAPSPWPWLAVLVVLVLALGVAALLQRRGSVLVGSALLTSIILVQWMATGEQPALIGSLAPWVGLGFAGLGLGWFELGRRRGLDLSWSAGIGLLGAQALLLGLNGNSLVPSFGVHVTVHGLLALGLLWLAWRSRRQFWSVVLALSCGVLLAAFLNLGGSSPMQARQLLELALPLYLLQLGYPLALGRAAREERLPFLAILVASAVFFLAARPALTTLGCGGCIGALPVLQALLLVPHLRRLLQLQPLGQRELGRLALVAGGILALISVAIPLQLEKQWITLGWALLGLALAWLYGKVPHKGLLTWMAGLFLVVFARLALNPAVLEYHERGGVPLLNWYLYAYLLAAGCCFGAAWLLKGRDDQLPWGLPRLSKPLVIGGAVLLFLLLNIEIADLFSSGPVLTFNLSHGSLSQDLSYTLGWALYSVLMLAAGILARNHGTRVAAIILLTVTVLKAFLHDLSRLQGLYRVGSFVGLAFTLALVAVILQKFVLVKSEGQA